jgi:DNA processing protein
LLAEAVGTPPPERPGRIAAARERGRAAIAASRRNRLAILPWHHPSYPAWLATIPDPPIVLWTRGHVGVLDRPSVAVVGSRTPTPAGLLMARRLARELAEAGLVVVSGLARGIDRAAHEGTLDGGGSTIAVLGSGADVIYPHEHGPLVERLLHGGALVSELAPGTSPLPPHFPLRNRIISGLARAVVVVEAAERSGSLITARAALEQGRDVLAVPGNPASGRFRGCHALIKDGARLVETVEDVLDEIGWKRAGVGPRDDLSRKSLPYSQLEAAMAVGEPYSIDDLCLRTSRSAPDVLADLGVLEVHGRVRRIGGGAYVRLDEAGTDSRAARGEPRP